MSNLCKFKKIYPGKTSNKTQIDLGNFKVKYLIMKIIIKTKNANALGPLIILKDYKKIIDFINIYEINNCVEQNFDF